MLVTSKEMFKKAQEGGYAIPAPNFIDLESLRWHVETAEKLNVPLILPLAEAHIGENITLEDAALVGKNTRRRQRCRLRCIWTMGRIPKSLKRLWTLDSPQ